MADIMNILRTLFRRLGPSPSPLRGTAGAMAETMPMPANRDGWLLAYAAMPRY
ncbi:MAG TPA: hypothetical protein VN028_07090 [Rhodocyclaceae bacterium]|nr:hypothetical protein [Rhodocyclaceae bacterium]